MFSLWAKKGQKSQLPSMTGGREWWECHQTNQVAQYFDGLFAEWLSNLPNMDRRVTMRTGLIGRGDFTLARFKGPPRQTCGFHCCPAISRKESVACVGRAKFRLGVGWLKCLHKTGIYFKKR